MKEPVYEIREIGLRTCEQHRDDPDFNKLKLREEVTRQCAERGIECAPELLEEALGKIGL